MALTTYAELLTSLQAWAKPNTTLLAPEVTLMADYVRLFEAEMNKVLMHPRMDALDTLDIIDGRADIPDDLLNVKKIQLTQSPWTIMGIDDSDIPEATEGYSAGSPTKYQWVGDEFIFNTSGDYTAGIRYRPTLPPLSSAVNWLYQAHPDLYLFGSLVQAGIRFVDEDKLKLAQAQYDRGLMLFNNMAALNHAGALNVQPSMGVV